MRCPSTFIHSCTRNQLGQFLLSAQSHVQAKIFLLPVGLTIILGLIPCVTVHRWKLVDETTSPKEDVPVSVFTTVYPMTFCKNRAEQKFTYELQEGI